jgi:hypothetical protein
MALQLQFRKVAGSNRLVAASAAQKAIKKVQFCTGKVCKKQGSQQVGCSSCQAGTADTDITCCCFKWCTWSSTRALPCCCCLQLLKFAQDLSIDELEVSDCGCLGELRQSQRYQGAWQICWLLVVEQLHARAVLACVFS